MARDSIPLLTANPLPVIGCGIEVLVVRACVQPRLWTGGSEPTQGDVWSAACLLVAVRPSDGERRAGRALESTIVGAQPSWVISQTIGGLVRDLATLTAEIQANDVKVVLQLPSDPSEDDRRLVGEFLGKYRTLIPESMIIGVSESPVAWGDVVELDRMVRPQKRQTSLAALSMFRLVLATAAANAAPELCDEDLMAVLGTPSKPAWFVFGAWLKHHDSIVMSRREEMILRHSDVVAFHAPDGLERLDEHRDLCTTIKSMCVHATQVHSAKTEGLLADVPAGQVLVVGVLCKLYRPYEEAGDDWE